MERDDRLTALRWVSERHRAVLVQQVEVRGSSPRESGARMVVDEHTCIGTIGGGHLELKAIEIAREMLRSGEMHAHVQQFALGPSLGQCCGGSVALRWSVLDPAAVDGWPEPQPLFHLQLHGAGHVGRAIARLLATLDVRVDWIDERESEFPGSLGERDWPSHITRRSSPVPEDEVRDAPSGGCYLVLTHSHDLDLRICEAVLRRDDFAYLGLIGSRSKRERFIHRLEAKGLSPQSLAWMTCPIGIDGIIGKQPEVVAVSVVAQLMRDAIRSRPLAAAAQPG
ncbi:xanthine dehydrogenase accessory protein XdhC [Piscinibacter terrae]|uniref:Xanthine dehydrogenase accessory protein XdhC n=1 Tax=Piscinibacter terrae TaxID=2496871 RepID=A0A3N7K2Z0_9BURK|nr:xanthine dehydrogenase accessory protein XdhC [Albitalea terrae]RQP25295.1 xanthine dehydrogenase accessory protein XdhC [Albitalea terrae]